MARINIYIFGNCLIWLYWRIIHLPWYVTQRSWCVDPDLLLPSIQHRNRPQWKISYMLLLLWPSSSSLSLSLPTNSSLGLISPCLDDSQNGVFLLMASSSNVCSYVCTWYSTSQGSQKLSDLIKQQRSLQITDYYEIHFYLTLMCIQFISWSLYQSHLCLCSTVAPRWAKRWSPEEIGQFHAH